MWRGLWIFSTFAKRTNVRTHAYEVVIALNDRRYGPMRCVPEKI